MSLLANSIVQSSTNWLATVAVKLSIFRFRIACIQVAAVGERRVGINCVFSITASHYLVIWHNIVGSGKIEVTSFDFSA